LISYAPSRKSDVRDSTTLFTSAVKKYVRDKTFKFKLKINP